jgi:diamine N-acetyltransferase
MLHLVPLHESHLDHVMTWVNDHEVMAYFAARQKDITREEEAAYLKTLIASKNDRAFSIFATDRKLFAGDDLNPGTYVGQCSINQIHWPSKNGRLFLTIRKEMQGQGYGAAAIDELLTHHAFNPKRLGLHKVWLIVQAENLAAQAMYLKAGFAFEGLLKDEYLVGDKYYDMVRMGRIA